MPAVQLPRLKKQISELTWKFTRPGEFQQDLNALFDFYSNQVLKPGRAVPSNRRIEAYHIPPIILNQLELELGPYVRENPGAALVLADTLWKDQRLEPRLLAVSILSSIPTALSEEVIRRLILWSKTSPDSKSLEALLNTGARRIRREKTEQWLGLIGDWLSDNSTAQKILGIQALAPAAREQEFENLPVVFQLIHPVMDDPPGSLQPALIELLQILAKRTPQETLYFLKHHLILNNKVGTLRVVRRLIPSFEPDQQTQLKLFLTEQFKTAEEKSTGIA